MELDHRLRTRLLEMEQKGLRRTPPRITRRHGAHYYLDDHPVVGFCSNDYLGLHDHPHPPLPATPAGASASRLICGDTPVHRALEAELADALGTEDAVLFPSGYQANVSALPALLEAPDTVYSDALNHASIIDGLRLARARVQVLPHRTPPPPPDPPPQPNQQTPKSPTRQLPPARWWCTETLFSMDGDAPDPEALRAFQAEGGHLYLDEAHALGLHPGGGGYAECHRLRPELRAITLGKAYGVAGAAVAGSSLACDWLRNTARGFVFTTGPSPLVCALIRHRLELVAGPEGERRRATLHDNIRLLASRLELPIEGPIVPLAVGDNVVAVEITRALVRMGYHVQAIRPPTVPRGTARLRLTLSAAHRPQQIEGLVAALREVMTRYGMRPTLHPAPTPPTPPSP